MTQLTDERDIQRRVDAVFSDAIERRLAVSDGPTLWPAALPPIPVALPPSSQTLKAALESVREFTEAFKSTSRGFALSDDESTDETALIDHISILEDIKSAAAAAQARVTHAFVKARAAREEVEGVPEEQRARGLGAEIGLARRESPHAGSKATRMAYTLSEHMPHALTALTDGRLSEYAASVVVKEVTVLDPEAQSLIDERMTDRYGALGPRRLGDEVRALANQVDAKAQVKKRQIAVNERRVTVRPAPDAMAYLTALLPVEQAIACKKALIDAASIAPGPPPGAGEMARTNAQAEADILVERLTGQSSPQAISVELNLVMTDTAVFGASRHDLTEIAQRDVVGQPNVDVSPRTATSSSDTEDENFADPVQASAWIPGHGPIPAAIARDLLSSAHDAPGSDVSTHKGQETHTSRVFLRRVLTDPVTGDITAMDTRRRAFTGSLRRALILRDDHCRTPWCDAPIVHLDHTHPYANGGETSATNGTGLCARCNYTKEYDGWDHHKGNQTPRNQQGAAPETEVGPAHAPGGNDRTVITPTGHSYRSQAPPLIPDLSSDYNVRRTS